MKKNLRVIIVALLCAASYTACQRASEEKHAEERQEALDSLNQTYYSLSDSMQLRWDVIMAEEDQRLSDMRRLLEEVSYTPEHTYNTARLDTLQQQLEQLYNMRFDPLTMTSEQIDEYDSASAAVKSNIINFVQNHPNIEEYPLMGNLIDSLEAAEQRMLFHRVEYDNFARDYNHFLEGNREFVREVDTTGLHQKRTLFQISE